MHKNVRKIFFSITEIYLFSDNYFKTKRLPLFHYGVPNLVNYLFNKQVQDVNMVEILKFAPKANSGKLKSF